MVSPLSPADLLNVCYFADLEPTMKHTFKEWSTWTSEAGMPLPLEFSQLG